MLTALEVVKVGAEKEDKEVLDRVFAERTVKLPGGKTMRRDVIK